MTNMRSYINYPNYKVHYRQLGTTKTFCGLKLPTEWWLNWSYKLEDVTCKRCLKKYSKLPD